MAGRRNKKFDALVADTEVKTTADILERVQTQKIKVHPYYANLIKALLVDNAPLINQDPVLNEASNDEICTTICVVTDRLYKAVTAAAEERKKNQGYMRALYAMVASQPANLSEEDRAYATLVVRVHTRSLVEFKPAGPELAPIVPDKLIGAERGECSDHERSWVRAAGELGALGVVSVSVGTALAGAVGVGGLVAAGGSTLMGVAAGGAVGAGATGALGGLYDRYRLQGRRSRCLSAGCTPDERGVGIGMYCVTCGQLLDSLQTGRFRPIPMSTAGWVDFLMQQFALITDKKASGCVVSLEALALLSLLAHTARNKRRLAGALDALLQI